MVHRLLLASTRLVSTRLVSLRSSHATATMDTFAGLKRRTTDLLQSLPAAPAFSSSAGGPASTLQGTWERIALPPLPRSSHSVNVVGGTAYVFGGESVSVRAPADNVMHAIVLPTGSAAADYYTIPAEPAQGTNRAADAPTLTVSAPEADAEAEAEDADADAGKEKEQEKEKETLVDEDILAPLPDVPPPRVGHATAVIGSRIFMFGGRGGPDMRALDERGRVWVFDTKTHTWSFLDPLAPPVPAPIRPDASPDTAGAAPRTFPESRSYHAATACDFPAAGDQQNRAHAASWAQWAAGDSASVGTPQRPIVGAVAAAARDVDDDGFGTFFVHAGCLSSGGRASDVWAFDVRTRVWSELPAAPGLPRGGTAFCGSRGLSGSTRLYRFGGFNGSGEEGGRLDYLDLDVSSPDDTSAAGATPAVGARGAWQSIVPEASSETKTDSETGSAWPGNRSVAGLHAITVGGGYEYLVLALGERTPSGSGHDAAGTFWDDVWALRLPSDHLSGAGVSDAVRRVLPKRFASAAAGVWQPVSVAAYDDEDDAAAAGPGARGWFASAPVRDFAENGIVVWGGLNADNQRLADGWVFRLGSETRE